MVLVFQECHGAMALLLLQLLQQCCNIVETMLQDYCNNVATVATLLQQMQQLLAAKMRHNSDFLTINENFFKTHL